MKQILEQYQKLKKRRLLLEESVKDYWYDSFGLKAVGVDGMPKSNHISDLSDKLVQFEDRASKAKQELKEINTKLTLIENAVDNIPDEKVKRTVRIRYINGMDIPCPKSMTDAVSFTDQEKNLILGRLTAGNRLLLL